MLNNARHVADDHGRSRYVKTYSLILFQVGSVNSNDVQNSYQNFVQRSY